MIRRLFERWYAAQMYEMAAAIAKTQAECVVALRELEQSIPSKRVEQIEMELAELRELHNTLLDSHKRLRSKYGMRDFRERERGNGNDPVLGQAELLAELERKHNLRK